jgi:hypothetical protein
MLSMPTGWHVLNHYSCAGPIVATRLYYPSVCPREKRLCPRVNGDFRVSHGCLTKTVVSTNDSAPQL